MIDIATAPLLDDFMTNALEGAYETWQENGFRETFHRLFAFCEAQGKDKMVCFGVLINVLNWLAPKCAIADAMFDAMVERIVEGGDFTQEEIDDFLDYAEN